jgi:hypothetical protein
MSGHKDIFIVTEKKCGNWCIPFTFRTAGSKCNSCFITSIIIRLIGISVLALPLISHFSIGSVEQHKLGRDIIICDRSISVMNDPNLSSIGLYYVSAFSIFLALSVLISFRPCCIAFYPYMLSALFLVACAIGITSQSIVFSSFIVLPQKDFALACFSSLRSESHIYIPDPNILMIPISESTTSIVSTKNCSYHPIKIEIEKFCPQGHELIRDLVPSLGSQFFICPVFYQQDIIDICYTEYANYSWSAFIDMFPLISFMFFLFSMVSPFILSSHYLDTRRLAARRTDLYGFSIVMEDTRIQESYESSEIGNESSDTDNEEGAINGDTEDKIEGLVPNTKEKILLTSKKNPITYDTVSIGNQ